MELWEYTGKNIKVTLNNGRIFKGKCTGYTQDIDNTPEVASIGLQDEEGIKNRFQYELYENEIKSIESID